MSNALVPYITAVKDEAFDTGDSFKELRLMDPLGLQRQTQIIEKQTLAITKPADYITQRNNAIKAAEYKVYKLWALDYQAQLAKGVVDSLARQKADAVANGLFQGEMSAIDAEFPLSAVGMAIESQRDLNTKGLSHGQKNIALATGKKSTGGKRKKSSKKGTSSKKQMASLVKQVVKALKK